MCDFLFLQILHKRRFFEVFWRYNRRPQQSRTYFLFLLFLSNFYELVEPDFFPECCEYRSAPRASENDSADGPRPRTYGVGARRSQPHRQPICQPFYAAVQRPISAREHSPPTAAEVFCCAPIFRSTLGLRAPPETDLLVLLSGSRSWWACSPRHQRLSLKAYGESWPSPSAETLRSGKKVVTPRATLGVTGTWQQPGEIVSRSREETKRPRNTAHLISFYLFIYFLLFYFILLNFYALPFIRNVLFF